MKDALRKFIKVMLLKKYPFYLDVLVTYSNGYLNPRQKDCYEIFLVMFEEDLEKGWGSREYIDELVKYLGVNVCGVYNEIVDKEEWEQIKSEMED